MRVEQLSIDGFRGFDVVVVRPRNHVALVGEPRAGRSDVIAALERVLQVEATRSGQEPFLNLGMDHRDPLSPRLQRGPREASCAHGRLVR